MADPQGKYLLLVEAWLNDAEGPTSEDARTHLQERAQALLLVARGEVFENAAPPLLPESEPIAPGAHPSE